MSIVVKGRRKILPRDVPGRENREIRMWTLQSKPGSTLEALENAYTGALAAVDTAESTGRQLFADKRYTEDGARDQFRNHILRDSVPALHRGRMAVNRARQELDQKRATLQLPKGEPTDAAAAIRRMGIQTWLRSLSQQERDNVTRAENIDPMIREAILEVPAMMTGIAETHRALLAETTLRETHGPLMDEIAELSEAIEVAESAIQAGRDSVRIDTGLSPAEFEEQARAVESRHSVAWLRRRGSELRVVDLERGVWREATPDELASGIEAATLEEFEAKRVA
ncbi:hypothetical protein [Bradyrhizobium sp. Bra64]|uniref:hypothetical protein n=1 Tax=Bradyrhizobium sp. Bra64 TaxID=2926009 RepID=UPI002118E920|nr:hypothetical protein [Bradyrhizobium sp. Bra64]